MSAGPGDGGPRLWWGQRNTWSYGLGAGTSSTKTPMGTHTSAGCVIAGGRSALGWSLGTCGRYFLQTDNPSRFCCHCFRFLSSHRFLNTNLFTALIFVSIQCILLLPSKPALCSFNLFQIFNHISSSWERRNDGAVSLGLSAVCSRVRCRCCLSSSSPRRVRGRWLHWAGRGRLGSLPVAGKDPGSVSARSVAGKKGAPFYGEITLHWGSRRCSGRAVSASHGFWGDEMRSRN